MAVVPDMTATLTIQGPTAEDVRRSVASQIRAQAIATLEAANAIDPDGFELVAAEPGRLKGELLDFEEKLTSDADRKVFAETLGRMLRSPNLRHFEQARSWGALAVVDLLVEIGAIHKDNAWMVKSAAKEVQEK